MPQRTAERHGYGRSVTDSRTSRWPLSFSGMLAMLAFGCADPAKSKRTAAEDSGDSPGETDTGEEEEPVTPVQLRLPLDEPGAFDGRLGVDHDPEVHTGIERLFCLDYLERSFPHCYDEHDGTDILLRGGFSAMDAGSAAIVAAADGLVVGMDDGNYDGCHGDLSSGENDCDGHPMKANYVTLEHETGHQTLYWHMRTDSVAVEEGDWVTMGTVLGLVGSSGNSAMPHLHFELHDAAGEVIDPFAGPLSQDESWWCDQGADAGLPGRCD
jgi:murein DD-endopeptidase MepM/ murein hydrolase activator NlpD